MTKYARCQNCGMMFMPIGKRQDCCGRDCQEVIDGIGRQPGDPTPEEIEAACKRFRQLVEREAIGLKPS